MSNMLNQCIKVGFILKLTKCPRCELNYLRPGETLCDVCKREIGRKNIHEESVEICPACNEHPVEPGEELCRFCMRDAMRMDNDDLVEDDEDEEKFGTDADLEAEDDIDSEELTDIDSLDDEILDDEILDEEIPESDLSEINSEFAFHDEAEDYDDNDEDELLEDDQMIEEQ